MTEAAPASAPVALSTAPLPDSVPSDLPRNATPRHYIIEVTPDMEALTFTGRITISLDIHEPSDAIVLNANELQIDGARLRPDDGGGPMVLMARTDPAAQTARFTAGQPIPPGSYLMEIAYSGVINTQATGLFALDYPDKRTGKDMRGLFTQFEAPDARRFAPLFDEPSYKATFDLMATVPQDLMAVSNMPVESETPLDNGLKRVTFGTSPKMSSYLLFFGLGDFERKTAMAADGTEIGIVSPAGSGNQADYALESMAGMMPYFEDYFGVGYPLPKLDNIAGPGSSQFFGAMENWGAIFTFERILLLDPAITSVAAKQDIYSVAAHETAHQWFGNIVTMAWWDDLWLNEGFASWMETKATDHFNPEWQALFSRVAGREGAMGLDAFATTHPVVQEISTVDELGAAFDTIAYQKGEAVISMLEAYAGEDVWREGIRRYMREHAYSNTRSSDLWAAVEAAGAEDLIEIARDFTMQPGVPLVRVRAAQCVGGDTRLALEQSEFSRDRRAQAMANPQSWKVPMLVRIGNQEGTRHVLEGWADLTLEGCGPIVVNGGQLGYFRTLYTPEALAQLTDAFGSLAPIDQYGLLRDNIALSRSGHQPLGAGLDVLAAVQPTAEATLAASAIARWGEFYALLHDEGARADLARRVAAAWLPRLQELGFEQAEGERIVDSELRVALIGVLGEIGNETVLAEASRRFASLASDPTAMDGPLKTTWLAVIAKNASSDQWALLRRLGAESASAVEREIYYSALGDNADDAIAREALALALTDEPGNTTSAQIIENVAALHPALAWDFVAGNRAAVEAFVDASGLPGFYASLLGAADTMEMMAKGNLYRDTLSEGQRAAMNRSLAALQDRIESLPRQRAGLREWLAAN